MLLYGKSIDIRIYTICIINLNLTLKKNKLSCALVGLEVSVRQANGAVL